MGKEIVLTGITTSGTPHLGNYVGAIRPAIEASNRADTEAFFFLADYHALIKCQDAERVQQSRLEIAATWLACGLDTDKATFYRQSDIPEISELNWLLTCVTAKGLMNRAHAYKAGVDENVASEQDPDFGITMGLFCYPVLMAADILAFNAHKVPVGRDQIQHIEMARDIAGRFNHIYGSEFFVMPEAVVGDSTAILQGLDGRKMSKSYNNTIPLFDTEKKLKKGINKIKTNLLEPGEPKDPNDSTVFEVYQAFATPEQTEEMRQKFADGIAWGEAKKELFELVNGQLGDAREKYLELMANPAQIEEVLQAGAVKARARARDHIKQLREAVGLVNFV
ncbi:tryptophan--tRNA ligase [Marinomonas mediterranea]|jgi:tryptophanyl-tRNA synthetase (EC 6.1.1.2)|uniref:Tryptophan--tRNA ligase n=1 Tax=Marinomonas mediterranea (strain ATCC 700492 / JCM 21426 / NBRC 103028 / MMB-1) TaxID=717774 RepID=F2JZ43_MARM1|nr:tryptophan--tRNA ligase [Marinomonas mediterranea]ADZ92021.1 tryptophanyl-tRNA synthetase [Marinomonas mediterranea MMB-1]WCN18097.1 tryptophan--tRNA ligase [Marinomonas mediterranea MMB-1]